MLIYALSTCLWLLANAERTIIEDARVRFHKSSELLLPNYIIAPEILNGRRTFFVLEYEQIPSRFSTPIGLFIRVRKFDDEWGVKPIVCLLNRTVGYDAKNYGVDEFRRLSWNTFMFTWYEETWFTDRITYMAYVDVTQCGSNEFSPNALRGKTYLVHKDYERFDVMVHDPALCKKAGRSCRLSYDPYQNNKGTISPFPFHLDWETLHVDYMPGEAYIVRGYQGDNLMVMRMDENTGDTRLLTKIPDKDRIIDYVSSAGVSCWTPDPRNDGRTIFCHMVDGLGRETMSVFLKYDGPVAPVNVVPLKNKDNELFVVAMRVDCTGGDCWQLWGTRVKASTKKYEHIRLNFLCSEEKSKLMIYDCVWDEDGGRMELHYACRNGQSYTFSVFFIY